MSIRERVTVGIFGVVLASIFGVLLAWMVMAVAIGTDDKGKTGAPAEKIKIIRVRSVLTDTQDRFMLIGKKGTDKREGYWTNPESGEQVKVLESRPVLIVIPWAHFMLADEHH